MCAAAAFVRRHRKFLLNLTTSAGLLALGDLSAQIVYERKHALDQKRLRTIIVWQANFTTRISILVAATLTGATMGIQAHVWYGFLDRFIAQATWKNVFKKVLLDQTIAAPMYTMTYILGKILSLISIAHSHLLPSRYIDSRRSNISIGIERWYQRQFSSIVFGWLSDLYSCPDHQFQIHLSFLSCTVYVRNFLRFQCVSQCFQTYARKRRMNVDNRCQSSAEIVFEKVLSTNGVILNDKRLFEEENKKPRFLFVGKLCKQRFVLLGKTDKQMKRSVVSFILSMRAKSINHVIVLVIDWPLSLHNAKREKNFTWKSMFIEVWRLFLFLPLFSSPFHLISNDWASVSRRTRLAFILRLTDRLHTLRFFSFSFSLFSSISSPHTTSIRSNQQQQLFLIIFLRFTNTNDNNQTNEWRETKYTTTTTTKKKKSY